MSEVFGKYELLKRIGGGGMGEVFLARQTGLGGFTKLSVVKTLLPTLEDDPAFVSMFLDEARLAARLSHPNVCEIYDLGHVDGILYLAMEYIRGDDLERLQKSTASAGFSLPPALVARIVADAASGLHHAHQMVDDEGRSLQLIHRDVTPANILVTWDGQVKLVDFGLAKAKGRLTQTRAGVLKGKFAYMAPEQISGSDVDHRLDVFALGIVLHELLTGKRLFRRESDMMTLAAVSTCDVPSPSKINPDIAPELDAIALKALQKDRNNRFLDAGAMAFALEEYLRQSREPASNMHLSKFVRQLYRERIERERTRGPAWDAAPGPVSKLRALARQREASVASAVRAASEPGTTRDLATEETQPGISSAGLKPPRDLSKRERSDVVRRIKRLFD